MFVKWEENAPSYWVWENNAVAFPTWDIFSYSWSRHHEIAYKCVVKTCTNIQWQLDLRCWQNFLSIVLLLYPSLSSSPFVLISFSPLLYEMLTSSSFPNFSPRSTHLHIQYLNPFATFLLIPRFSGSLLSSHLLLHASCLSSSSS